MFSRKSSPRCERSSTSHASLTSFESHDAPWSHPLARPVGPRCRDGVRVRDGSVLGARGTAAARDAVPLRPAARSPRGSLGGISSSPGGGGGRDRAIRRREVLRDAPRRSPSRNSPSVARRPPPERPGERGRGVAGRPRRRKPARRGEPARFAQRGERALAQTKSAPGQAPRRGVARARASGEVARAGIEPRTARCEGGVRDRRAV